MYIYNVNVLISHPISVILILCAHFFSCAQYHVTSRYCPCYYYYLCNLCHCLCLHTNAPEQNSTFYRFVQIFHHKSGVCVCVYFVASCAFASEQCYTKYVECWNTILRCNMKFNLPHNLILMPSTRYGTERCMEAPSSSTFNISLWNERYADGLCSFLLVFTTAAEATAAT